MTVRHPLRGCPMSRISWSAILALLLAAPPALGSSEGFLATRVLEKSRAAAQQARTADEDDDDEDDGQVTAFTPVSEAEEVEANGDDAADVDDAEEAEAPDDSEPEEVGFDNAGAETESENEDADEATGSE